MGLQAQVMAIKVTGWGAGNCARVIPSRTADRQTRELRQREMWVYLLLQQYHAGRLCQYGI